MATVRDIAIGNSYKGDPFLGGAEVGVYNIDTKPLQNLAQYTFFYKKSLWDQKQKDTNEAIAKLADLSNISLNDLRDKDKVQGTQEFAVLLNKASEYARKTPKTSEEKIQNELEWQTEFGKFKNNFNSGKQRAVSYMARYNAIMKGTDDAKAKDAQIKILDKEFADTDIGTPISGTLNFKTQSFEVPDPATQKFSSVIIGGNENLAVEGAVYNPKLNAGTADAAVVGIKKYYPKKGTPEYNSLSQSEKNQAEVQATVESASKGWVDATEPLNHALKNYIDADGNFNSKKFEDENASNITLMNAYNALKRYDSYNREKYNQATSGAFNDKGISVKLPDNLNPEDFKAGFVDFSKGVNANQLVQSGMFAKYQGDLFNKKVTETDNDIQKRGQDFDLEATKLRIKADEEKWKASQVGSTTQINGAAERGNRIYDDLLKLTDKHGVITPDKVRQLNVEQLKYLGIEQPQERDASGLIISQGGFKPLDLSEGSDEKNPIKYAIQLGGGQVRVLKNAKLSPTGSETYYGEFDPTKSTNIHNIRTNILNEELQKAGSKELNSYIGIDVTGKPTQTTEGGSTTISGSTKTPISLTGKIDVNTLEVGQPYSVSGKLYIWDGKKLKAQ